MAKAADDADSELLAFVETQYADLKTEAEKDNNESPNPKQSEVTAVIALIDALFNTIKSDFTHEEIVKQLQEIKKQYSDLKLNHAEYTRYKEADENLNTIMAGLEEVEAASGTASGTASASSTASAPASRELALVPLNNTKQIAPSSIASASESTELALVPLNNTNQIAPASIASTASESRELALVSTTKN
jgi:predicted amino acid racemase